MFYERALTKKNRIYMYSQVYLVANTAELSILLFSYLIFFVPYLILIVSYLIFLNGIFSIPISMNSFFTVYLCALQQYTQSSQSVHCAKNFSKQLSLPPNSSPLWFVISREQKNFVFVR